MKGVASDPVPHPLLRCPMNQFSLRMASVRPGILSNSGAKPPNILIYQPGKDATSKDFIQTKSSLEYCLTPERNVIYPLGLDDILQHSPWKDNCRLLVIPPPTGHAQESGGQDATMSPRVLEEFVGYVRAGGRLISLHPYINHVLGLAPIGNVFTRDRTKDRPFLGDYCQDGVCDVAVFCDGSMETKHRFSSLVPTSRAGSCNEYLRSNLLHNSILSKSNLAYLVPLEWNMDAEYVEQNTNESNNNQLGRPFHTPEQRSHDLTIPCVRRLIFTNNGYAIISNVDIFPLFPDGLEISPLVKLKRGVIQRRSFLSNLLGNLELECSIKALPNLTHTFLMCSKKECHSRFISAIRPLLSDSVIKGRDISLRIISTDYTKGTPVDEPPKPSTAELTVVTNPAQWQVNALPFSSKMYFGKLETRELGRTLLYTSVITSTQLPFTGNMSFCRAIQPEMGMVLVAGQQTRGKGRSGNAWISPLGSMMFSTSLLLLPSTRLSSHLPFLQHIVAIAVVHGIRSLPGYEHLPLRIKWPNDIYYDSQVKLGGILVSCLSMGNDSALTAIIGCGVNISNKYPTMSINDAIAIYNTQNGRHLPPLSVEMVLACTFNWLEKLLTHYEVQGLEPVLNLYYKYWLHSNAKVYLASHGDEEATVRGIDKYGYLQVQRKGEEWLSLQPDGNSFDIMKGLIVMKT